MLNAYGVKVDKDGNPRNRITECDSAGNPRTNVMVSRSVLGTGVTPEVQILYLTGTPTSGDYTLTLDDAETAPIAYNANAATVLSRLLAVGITASTVTGTGTVTNPFKVTFLNNTPRNLLEASSTLNGGDKIFNGDFFLSDEELGSLPSEVTTNDSLAGLILRPRAANTWNQL